VKFDQSNIKCKSKHVDVVNADPNWSIIDQILNVKITKYGQVWIKQLYLIKNTNGRLAILYVIPNPSGGNYKIYEGGITIQISSKNLATWLRNRIKSPFYDNKAVIKRFNGYAASWTTIVDLNVDDYTISAITKLTKYGVVPVTQDNILHQTVIEWATDEPIF
jgi:hypothetical protein